MNDLQRTLEVAAALGISVEPTLLDELFSAYRPQLTEWSVNAADDPRASLRVTTFTDHRAHVADALAAFGGEPCLRVQRALPDDGIEGVGLALSAAAPPRLRWYRFASVDGGADLAAAAVRALPELDGALEDLRRACGSASLCTCLGMDVDAEGALRSTIYFHVSGPRVAIALLERIGALTTLEGNLFFKGLLGLDPARPRPWPKVWVGRSVGVGGGWKFYYFARGDLDRPSDAVLLDAVDAGPGLVRAVQALGGDRGPRVQLVGITFPDAVRAGELHTPRWTVYLGER